MAKRGKRDPKTLDPVRRRILEAARAQKRSLQSLSVEVLRERPGYLDDYMWKGGVGSPRHLREFHRRALANELGLPEADLREIAPPAHRPAAPGRNAPLCCVSEPDSLAWLAERLAAIHDDERMPLTTRELVTSATFLYADLCDLPPEAFAEAAEAALASRRQHLREYRATILQARKAG